MITVNGGDRNPHNIFPRPIVTADLEYEAHSAASLLTFDEFYMLSIFFDADPRRHSGANFGRNVTYMTACTRPEEAIDAWDMF